MQVTFISASIQSLGSMMKHPWM